MSACATQHRSDATLLPTTALAPLRDASGGGVFKIPARGGARVLVLVEWDMADAGEDAILILYGVFAEGERFPLAIAYGDDSATAATFGPLPLFMVGGYPVDHYEIDGLANAATVKVRATAMVGAAASGALECFVNAAASRHTLDLSAATPTAAYSAALSVEQWVSTTTRPGYGGRRFASVTPSDAADLDRAPTDGIYVGTAGNLRFIDEFDDDVTLTNLSAGMIHPIRAKRIYSTSTTASGIFAVYGV